MPLARVKEIVSQVEQLTVTEQDTLYSELTPWLSAMKLRSERATLEDLREARFSKGLQCPRCESTQVKRNGSFAVTGKGQPTAARVKEVLQPVIQSESVLCTDGAFQYRRFSRDTGIRHRPIDGKKRLKGSIYHINNINGYHGRLKTWMVRFKGVATKYLPNYMAWHQYVDQAAKMSPSAAAKQMLVETCSVVIARKVA